MAVNGNRAMKLRGFAIAGALLLFAACPAPGDPAATPPAQPDPDQTLNETAANLAQIRSGSLDFRIEVESADRDPSGFRGGGPFSLDSQGQLPVTDIEYISFAQGQEFSGRFTSDGQTATLERAGMTAQMTQAQLDEMGVLGFVNGAFANIPLEGWVEGEIEIASGGRVDGELVDQLSVGMHAASAAQLLSVVARGLASEARGALAQVRDADTEAVQASVSASRMRLYTGGEDRILRRAVFEIEFVNDPPPGLDQLAAATSTIEAEITALNEPVEATAS